MKHLVHSADLISYNANSRGTSTGDCSVRSISLAFNRDYNDIKKLLNAAMEVTRSEKYNYSRNIVYVIKHILGAGPYTDINADKITVQDFADQHKSGTYLVGCSRKPNPKLSGDHLGGHLVTIINGKVFDTWDSRSWYVCRYWKINVSSNTLDTNIVNLGPYLRDLATASNKAWWTHNINSAFDKAVNKSRRLQSITDKNNLNIILSCDWSRLRYASFVYTLNLVFDFTIREYDIYEKTAKIVKIAIKPDTEQGDVENIIIAALEDKISGIVWSLVKRIEEIIEDYDSVSSVKDQEPYIWDAASRKMFNTLPYWVRRLTTSFEIYKGSYGEQYIDLYMMKPPFDNGSAGDRLRFHSTSKADLLEGLNYYKSTGDYQEASYIADR